MNYDIHYYKKILTKPINDIVNEIVEIVQLLSPLKDDSYKRNVKYTIRDYAIGIIDVIKNYTSWKSYNNFMKGDTLRKKFNEWSHRDGSEIITNIVCYDLRSSKTLSKTKFLGAPRK